VAGEDTTPYQRVAAAADFGNGISSLADFESLTYINPDLTIALHRLPIGEWVCLDAASRLETHGVGFAESALFDEQGRIGRSIQSVLVEARG
jgi:acyl-CoA thioesterase